MNKKISHSRWDQMITTQLLVFPTVKEKQTGVSDKLVSCIINFYDGDIPNAYNN